MVFSVDDKLAIMEAAPVLTVDTEGVKTAMGYSVAVDGLQQGFYLPYNHHHNNNLTKAQQDKAAQILHSREALVFHNAVHDLRVLANKYNIDYRGWFWDTMLMAHWINEERFAYDLTSVSKAYGGQPKQMPEQMSIVIESDGWDNVPQAWMDEYSSHDALITHQLFNKLKANFTPTEFNPNPEFPRELWAKEQEFIRDVMGPMMDLGIKVDVGFAIREYMRGQGIMDQCIQELGFKPSSSKALEQFLIVEMGLPVLKHTKSCSRCYPADRRTKPWPVVSHTARPAFDKEVMVQYDEMLEKIKDKRAQTILTYKGWQKTNTSNYKPYMELVDDSHVLHPGYKLHGTKTGRLSCAEPNLQQIPKNSEKDWNGNLKAAFIPRDGYGLFTIDYSQLQFRMTVAYAVAYAIQHGLHAESVRRLLEIFNDDDRDIFTEMATDMDWERPDVKTLVYLILFGGGAKRASVAFGVSVEAGGSLVNEFHDLYPEIKKVAKDCERAAMRQGYVTYWTGRRRHFPKGSAYYRAFNAAIQGGEAEIIKRAMIRLKKELCNDEFRMILQIHDEIAFEIAEGMEEHYLPKAQAILEDAAQEFCEYVGVHVKFKTQAKKWGEK